MVKRSVDILISVAGIILLSPLMIIIAVIIKVDSPGPVIYRAIRTGLYGKPFTMYKFRTMVNNADKLGGGSTGKNDPRITRVGRSLRRYKLDELPQLLNVFIGNMSLVGPRPELPVYTSLYKGQELIILNVKPGITDYSSLHFRELSEYLGDKNPDQVYEEQVMPIKNALRVKYVMEQSLWVDAKVIVKTIMKVIIGKKHEKTI